MGASETKGGLRAWWRLGCIAVALALGVQAYRLHIQMQTDWWRWIGELAIAVTLTSLAFWRPVDVTESALRRWLRRTLGVASLVLLAAATHHAGQPGRELATGICTVASLVCFFLFRWTPFSAMDAACLNGAVRESPGGRNALAWALGGAAVLAAVAAATVNRTDHVLGFALWLVSLVLLPAAMRRLGPGAIPDPACTWNLDGGPPLPRGTERVAVVLILLLAVALRVPMLEHFPAFINADEARLGRYAQRLWEAGFPDIFGLGWNAFPNLSLLVDYLPIQILGMDIAHARLASAIFGLGSLLATYFWARRWWGNVVALLAMLILTINHEHITWSRVGLNNIQQVFVGALMLATLARALQMRRPVDWVWLGFASGLTFYAYHAAKLFPALLFAVVLLYAFGIRGFVRRNLGGGLIAIVAFFFALGPHLVTIYLHWSYFYHNTSNRVDLPVLFDAYQGGDVDGVRYYLSSHVLGTLHLLTVNQWAFLDPFLCVPALLGIGWMLWRWRDPRHIAVLGWIGGIFLIGGMITAYPPNVPRLIGVLPLVCLIPAVVGGRVRGLLHEVLPARADSVVGLLLIAWLGAGFYHNSRTVFVLLPQVQRGDSMTGVCRIIGRTPLPATNYAVGSIGEADIRVAPIDCMMPLDVDRVTVSPVDDPSLFPVRPANRGTAVYFFSNQQAELVPAGLHYYPEAKYETIGNVEGFPHLWALTISPQEIDHRRGLRTTFRYGPRLQTPAAGLDILGCADCLDFPVEVTAAGIVFIPSPGLYGLRLPAGTVTVDGRSVPPNKAVELFAGWHELAVQTTLNGAGESVAVQWRTPEAPDWSDIPRDHLHTHPSMHGLLGRYYTRALPLDPATPSADVPDYTKLDLALSFDWSPEFDEPPLPGFAAKPSTMEWVGTVDLREGRTHRLRLETTAATRVFVDGKEVLASPGGYPATSEETTLAGLEGRVPILIRSVRPADDTTYLWWLHLHWGQPGGGWTAFADYNPPTP